MSWGAPQWGWALLAVLITALVVWLGARAHLARLARAFRGAMAERILPVAVRRRRLFRDAATLAGLVLLVAALAEPRAGKVMQSVEADGVDLVFVVDLSRSMDARDVDPSRLERARRELFDLLDLLQGDRVGLVIFAGGAWPSLPLTQDHGAVRLVVSELDTKTFQSQGSALGRGLREARKLLEQSPGEAGRAVLVLSDGEIHDPADAMAAADELAQAGIVVYGLVTGTDPAPIPNPDGSFLVDPKTGTKVMTAPSAAVLTDVARTTGGAVAQSVPSDDDVRRLYAEEIRGHLQASGSRTMQQESWNSLYQWPLGAGIFLMLLGGWLGDGRHLITLLALLVALPAHAGDLRAADSAYRSGDWARAIEELTELTLETPDDPDVWGRLGAARFRAGDHVGAARAFEHQSALQSDNPDARFNAGNAWYQSGHFDAALESYDQALEIRPDHPGATANRELLQQELQQRRMQQQQQPGGPPQQGQPQEGREPQEGQQAQPQPSEQGADAQSQAQQGAQQPSEAQPSGEQQSKADKGQPGQADPSDGSSPQSPDQQGEPADPTARRDEQGEAPSGEDDEDGEPGEDGGEPGEGQPGADPTGMSAEQASRTLDGVEEGRPHPYIPGGGEARPW